MHTSAALLALAILLGSAAGAGAQAPVQCNGAPLQAEELPSFSKQPYIVVFKGEGELQSASQGLTGVGFKRISQ